MDHTTCSITTRSTRSSRQISIDNTNMSQDNIAQTTARKNYTPNKTKTLKTKIKKCEKVFVDYNITGGGITGEMDTATFELFRSACTELFNDLPSTLGRCVNHKTFDEHQQALVQQTYFVKCDVNGVGWFHAESLSNKQQDAVVREERRPIYVQTSPGNSPNYDSISAR